MSTRATIAVRSEDGNIYAVYCHNHGDRVGPILAANYANRGEVWKLIRLGHLSSLGPRLVPDTKSIHSFSFPQPAVTVAYGRDRGLRWDFPAKPYKCSTMDELRGFATDHDADFLYLYDVATRMWFWAPHDFMAEKGTKPPVLVPVVVEAPKPVEPTPEPIYVVLLAA